MFDSVHFIFFPMIAFLYFFNKLRCDRFSLIKGYTQTCGILIIFMFLFEFLDHSTQTMVVKNHNREASMKFFNESSIFLSTDN